MNFETTIGLEVHVELKTKSKMFSPAPVTYGQEPNTETNVIDWGFPGVLPSINRGAYQLGIMLALALHADITRQTHFDRKNYFYPDNPKAYQITQSEKPLGTNGWVEIEVGGKKKKVGIAELHVEEDAGKNQHEDDGYSYVDLNRQGTPLVEIVSKPDITSPEEAYAYLETLRQIVQFTGASDVKMEEGSMRVDTNLSVRPIGQKHFGTKTEIKNLNSFVHVRDGLAYEEKRQQAVLLSGGEVRQETRRWDPDTKETILMRVKEGADDYRYFPEPDLVPIVISDEWLAEIKAKEPELRTAKLERYKKEYELPDYDAQIITGSKHMADIFEETTAICKKPKKVSNWLMGETLRLLKEHEKEPEDIAFSAENLAKLIELVDGGVINGNVAKEVFEQIFARNIDPEKYVEEKGLKTVNDEGALRKTIEQIVADNPKSVEDYHNGKEKAIGFLVGQTMKAMKGKADPGMVNKILKEIL